MREWREVHGQLHGQVVEMGLRENEKHAGYDAIHQALLSGLLGNIGFRPRMPRRRKPGEGDYDGARGIKFDLHPGSVLAKKGPKWVVVAELTDTGRLMGRTGGGSAAGMDRGGGPPSAADVLSSRTGRKSAPAWWRLRTRACTA